MRKKNSATHLCKSLGSVVLALGVVSTWGKYCYCIAKLLSREGLVR